MDSTETTDLGGGEPRWRDCGLAALLGAAAVVWSSIGMTRPSLWADEGATISATQRTWDQLWGLLHNIDAVHGAYYAVVKPWLDLAGVGSLALRSPSLVATGATVAITYLLSRRWLTRGLAIAAAVLTGALPRTSWMAIEGRPWAFTALLAVLSTLALHRFIQRPTKSRLVAYAVIIAGGAVVNIYLVFLVAAHGATLLLLHVPWRRFGQWLCAATAVAVASAPVLWASMQQRAQLGDRASLTPSDWLSGVLVKQFALGDTPGDVDVLVPRMLWGSGSVLVALVLWLVLVAGLGRTLVRDRRLGGGWAWVLPWLVLPPVAVGVLSIMGMQLYHPRYFSFTVPSFAIAAVLGTSRIGRRGLIIVIVGLVWVASVPVFISQRAVVSKNGYDWSEVARLVSDRRPAVQGVYYSSSPSMRVLGISYPGAFSGTRDLTITETPAEEGSLDGTSTELTSVDLTQAPDQLAAVWSNRATDRDADLAVLRAGGYRLTGRWTGSQTTVAFFERIHTNLAPR